MEYVGVKLFLALGFFGILLFAANWATEKIDEYWGDDDDKTDKTD